CLQRTAFLPVVSRGALHPISLLLCDGTATSAICTLSLHDALPIWVLLDFWWATDEGPLWTQTSGQEVVFFVARSDAAQVGTLLRPLRQWRSAEVGLKTFQNQPVNALYFRSHRTARDAQQLLDQAAIPYWEADIRPPERYLMERFVTAAAQLTLAEASATGKPPLNPRI